MTSALLAVLLANALWCLAWAGLAVACTLALGGRVRAVGLGIVSVVRFTVLGAEVRLGLVPVGSHVQPVFPVRSATPVHVAPPEAELEDGSPRDRLAAVVLPMALTVACLGLAGGLPALASVLRGLAQVPFPLGPDGYRLARTLAGLAAEDLWRATWLVAPKVVALGVLHGVLANPAFLLGERAARHVVGVAVLVGLAIPAGWLLALLRA